MKIEHQVCTLEQAKKLKELGVSQNAFFSWCGDENHYVEDKQWVFVSPTIPANNQEADHRALVESSRPFAAAFDVAELGVMLTIPRRIGKPGGYTVVFFGDNWIVVKDDKPHQKLAFEFEAHARAELLIIFLQENIITVQDANQRLDA
jgi:hypothetical protein